VPVVEGLEHRPSDDDLKALCAAAATSGALSLIHLVGITPEAPTAEAAMGGQVSVADVDVTRDDIQQTRRALTTAKGDEVDLVAFGSPHCSLAECRELADLVRGRVARPGVEVFVTTSRAVRSIAERLGIIAELERFGATVTADTCIVVAPLVKRGARVLMTNSAKYAHYGPGIIGVESVFGSTEECIWSAVSGRVTLNEAIWT
jgi:predicted aconitase